MLKLRPFQTDFIDRAMDPAVKIAVLSTPRGNGKSFLAAHLITRAMTPGDAMFQAGKEIVQLAGFRLTRRRMPCYGFVRATLEAGYPGEYRYIDSVTRLGITHKESNTKLRIHFEQWPKTAMGLVRT